MIRGRIDKCPAPEFIWEEILLLKRYIFIIIVVIRIVLPAFAGAGNPYDEYYKTYPGDEYIVGIGEAQASGNKYADRRITEVLARRDIASQIRVRTTEVSVDLMCGGQGAGDCKDTVVSIIETSVDEFLRGSRVVDSGVRDGSAFAIVVMPKEGAVRTLGTRIEGAVGVVKDDLAAARSGDMDALERAQSNLVRARTYEIERQILEGVRTNASSAMNELQKELDKLKADLK